MSIIDKLGITPGPYTHIIYDHGGSRLYREEGGNRNLICDTYGQKENALCFSQAPEMLMWIIGMIQSADNNDMVKAAKLLELGPELIEKATDKPWPEIKELS